jgi:hypothetical protein
MFSYQYNVVAHGSRSNHDAKPSRKMAMKKGESVILPNTSIGTFSFSFLLRSSVFGIESDIPDDWLMFEFRFGSDGGCESNIYFRQMITIAAAATTTTKDMNNETIIPTIYTIDFEKLTVWNSLLSAIVADAVDTFY